MKLSVIIPIFNGYHFLSKLIQDLNNINFDSFEVIFIDNNSTDKSLELLNELTRSVNFPYQILQELKQGAGNARNKGLKYAKGYYIAFLDCDDFVDKDKWKEDIEILEKYEIDFVFCRTQRIYQNGKISQHPIDGFIEGKNISPSIGLIWLSHYFYLQGTCSIVIKKQTIIELGGFPDLTIGEDAFLFIKLGLLFDGYFKNKVQSFYNRHENSTISVINNDILNKRKLNFKLKKFLLNDKQINKITPAKFILEKQILSDILFFHQKGFDIKILKNEINEIYSFKDKIVFNSISLFINKKFKNLKYNPFYQIWTRLK